MGYVVICISAFFISIITFFSGFGLGTVLMPVFAIFFPLPVAIAATAVVHLANNLFKVMLVGKLANWSVVLKFSIPAAIASALGAYLLAVISIQEPVTTYEIGNYNFKITAIGIFIGIIIILSSSVPILAQDGYIKSHLPLLNGLLVLCC